MIAHWVKQFGGRFFDLVCPPVCPCCGDVKQDGEPFCPKCVSKLATPEGEYCKRCGGKRYRILRETQDCVRCRSTKFFFEQAIVLGEYEKELRRLVLRMKTEKTGYLAAELVRLLVQYRKEVLQAAAPELAVSVPMHRSRRWERGVNPPDILAETLGHLLNIPVKTQTLQRIRPTEMQYTLSVRRRKENVQDAFTIRSKTLFGSVHFSTPLTGKRILLVDDIVTTGSTCNEASKMLLQAGAQNVTVCAVARAEGYWTAHRNAWLESTAND